MRESAVGFTSDGFFVVKPSFDHKEEFQDAPGIHYDACNFRHEALGNYSQRGNKTFPMWEQFIPSVGTTAGNACLLSPIVDVPFLPIFFQKKPRKMLKTGNICHFCTQSAPPNPLIIK